MVERQHKEIRASSVRFMICLYFTELSHVGKLREVREVREKLRDKCPTSYGKRLLSLNFPNDRRE